ncbi:MAG: hypothetical protein NVSMB17_09430 [Candidatus Dormibacteria bacterium]
MLVALPGIASQFHAGVGTLARLGALLSLGAAIALPLGAMADRWNRGRMATLGIVGFSLAAVASAMAPGIFPLAVARFAAVCMETLVAAVATACAVEVVEARRRGLAAAGAALCGGAGAAVAVVAYPLIAPHWQSLYLLAGVLGLFVAPVALLLPAGQSRRPGVAPTRVGPPRGTALVVLSAAAALGGLLFGPANFFSVLYGSRRLGLSPADLSLVLVASGAVAAVGYVLGGLLTDRVGRRLPAVILLVLSCVLAAISYLPSTLAYVVAGVGWSGVAAASAPVITAWTAELVPTPSRVTGYTVLGIAGSVGGVAGLVLVGAAETFLGLPAAIWLTVAPALLGIALLVSLPETGGTALPQ